MASTAAAVQTQSAKLLYTGKTHTTAGQNGVGRSADGFLDIDLPAPHPAAENLFGVAWSACFLGALGVAAAQKKLALPADAAVDAEIDLLNGGGLNFFLRAELQVSLPGIDRATAQSLVETAHEICPYSKATRGNVDVTVRLK